MSGAPKSSELVNTLSTEAYIGHIRWYATGDGNWADTHSVKHAGENPQTHLHSDNWVTQSDSAFRNTLAHEAYHAWYWNAYGISSGEPAAYDFADFCSNL